jgi:hypothetical protein
MLDLPTPDLSTARKSYRSPQWYPALPKGAFEYWPWPNGSDEESPGTAEERGPLLKKLLVADEQMTFANTLAPCVLRHRKSRGCSRASGSPFGYVSVVGVASRRSALIANRMIPSGVSLDRDHVPLERRGS